MNLRTRKILLYRLLAVLLLLVSLGVAIYALITIISMHPEKIVLDCIALGLTIAFPIAQIVLIIRGRKKESYLLDVAFNTDNTVNKIALAFVFAGTALGLGLNILSAVVLLTRVNTVAVTCSMLIISAISTYLLANCLIYLIFTFIFRKKELTLEDYAK